MQIQSALVALAASLVAAVPPLEIKGKDFYNSKTGEKFQVVGVAYQPGGSAAFTNSQPDPLSQPEQCKRDAALMQVMGVNAIRVYNLNPDLNHDECASIFNAVSRSTSRVSPCPRTRMLTSCLPLSLPRLACT